MQTIRNDMGRTDFQKAMEKDFSIGLSVNAIDAEPFWSQVVAYRGRTLQFASLRFSPHSTSSASNIHLQTSRMLVTLQKEGEVEVSQGGRTSKISVGQMFMIDPNKAFHIRTGEIQTHSVYLPPAMLRALMPGIDDMTAMAIDATKGVGAMFGHMLDQLFELAPTLDEPTADRIAEALPHMLSTALMSLGQSDEVSPNRLIAMHKLRIDQYIQANLADPSLDAESIAKGVGLSTRYVYELTASETETLMKRVWRLRLEQCKTDFSNAQLRNRSIGEIAYRWGFSDVAHFSRSFRDRYACSPREWRKLSQIES
jgi:AraC-like DNA-binding protein